MKDNLDRSSAAKMYDRVMVNLIDRYIQRQPDSLTEKLWICRKSSAGSYNADLDVPLVGTSVGISNGASRSLKEKWNFFLERFGYESNTLESLVEQRRKHRDVIGLDLMGYGAVLRDLGISGCAVAISDMRTEQEKQSDLLEGRGLIQGNILKSSTWRDTSCFLESLDSGRGFDFILCRPVKGIDSIPADRGVYTYLFNRLYQLLSRENGVLLTNYHPQLNQFMEEASAAISEVNGLSAKSDPGALGTLLPPAFCLIKGPESPQQLPRSVSDKLFAT